VTSTAPSSTAPSSTTSAPHAPTDASWSAVASLSLGILAIVMSEFLPASLLPRIAESLDVSEGAAGQSVTVTAVAGALSALFIAVVLPRADRRRVMLGLTALAVVSDLAVAVAPNLLVLLCARVLLGVALGGFWAMAASMAAHLVPADRIGRALTVINAGVSVAAVAAVPLGAWLGEVWGWRGVFLLGAGLAVLALVVQAVALPSVAAPASSGLRVLAATLRSRTVVLGLLGILLIFGGHFGGYTYIRPATESMADIDAGGLAALLLVFGVASVVGTMLSGPMADRALRVVVVVFPVAVAGGMLVMFATSGSTLGLYAAAALWGFGFGGVPTAVLSWGAKTEPDRLEQIGGLIVTVCNIAIAVGAVVGGLVIDHAADSMPLLVGGVAALCGGLVVTSLRPTR
jgi:predicted MFS family arabinose efflux permease